MSKSGNKLLGGGLLILSLPVGLYWLSMSLLYQPGFVWFLSLVVILAVLAFIFLYRKAVQVTGRTLMACLAASFLVALPWLIRGAVWMFLVSLLLGIITLGMIVLGLSWWQNSALPTPDKAL